MIRSRDTDLRVPHIGTYRRELPVSVERLYENAIDWQHLPYLHRSSFSRIERLDAGDWGFRAQVWEQPYDERRAFVIELRLDREGRRWITRTVDGPGLGSEVWTHAFPLAESRTFIVVDFFVPGLEPERIEAVGNFYRDLYARLYDEDVEMMTERQLQLDMIDLGGRGAPVGREHLGHIDKVRARLPMLVEAGNRIFRIVELDGELIAHSVLCPHTLGPLGKAPVIDGIIECGWHGYRFDIRTRRCVSGARCRLAPAPKITVDSATMNLVLEWDFIYDQS